MVLASFAEMVSRSDDSSRYGHSGRPSGLLFPHFHARQATLHEAHDSVHRNAGSILLRTQSGYPQIRNGCRTRAGLHGNRVGRYMPLHLARRP